MKKPANKRLFLVFIFLLSACVRVEENRNPALQPSRLLVTRDLQGVRLTLNTEKNIGYRIYYREEGQSWTLLPEGKLIRGTGEPVEIIDPASSAPRRRYRSETVVAPRS
ncbi:MAG: hypothetical protein JJU05_16155 [Verrucomicrobia bacterium]|nr:hypothetical protein [Verrucomicrobiota bacterium]MCH8528691.1 hypothetical protein [Kiritimatiellia bacterium]